jgi:hypothetical protein
MSSGRPGGDQPNASDLKPTADVGHPDAADVRTSTYEFERDQAGVS